MIDDHLRDAIIRYKQEGLRGISWSFMHTPNADLDAMDTMLVKSGHPLAFQPGTQESRFRNLVKEMAAAK